jgi:hypothetical protein
MGMETRGDSSGRPKNTHRSGVTVDAPRATDR